MAATDLQQGAVERAAAKIVNGYQTGVSAKSVTDSGRDRLFDHACDLQARKLAATKRVEVQVGRDPVAEKKAVREAPTVKELAETAPNVGIVPAQGADLAQEIVDADAMVGGRHRNTDCRGDRKTDLWRDRQQRLQSSGPGNCHYDGILERPFRF